MTGNVTTPTPTHDHSTSLELTGGVSAADIIISVVTQKSPVSQHDGGAVTLLAESQPALQRHSKVTVRCCNLVVKPVLIHGDDTINLSTKWIVLQPPWPVWTDCHRASSGTIID